MLLNDIENNTATITSTADFHLTNDGVSWKLDDSNTTIGNAIFGTLSNSPVSEEDSTNDHVSQNGCPVIRGQPSLFTAFILLFPVLLQDQVLQAAAR